CAEPYALSSMIIMPPNLEAGRARNPWLTGFVSWMLAAMGRRILGIRPDFDGLRIDPCVPRWKRFSVRRVFRATTYQIEIDNPDGVERGVREVRVDGKEIEGNLVPAVKGNKTVRVDVTMG
ncbi:MAG TPA: glycosyl transferase, partial [Phycisphaerae bacterium]|nr:glycosyl transferase [Phycisphaerae bacterium]